jgi:hypothetical protein
LPRFARNDAKDGIALRPSSRGTKRSMPCSRHCEARSDPWIAALRSQ